MGDVIYVTFRKLDPVPDVGSGDHLLQMLKADLEPEDYDELQKAIADWDHFITCDGVIQELAEYYFRITHKL